MKNNENIVELIKKILDDPSDSIPLDLFNQLSDELSDSEVLCPVENDQIALLNIGYRTFIPASCDIDDFKNIFKDVSWEIFKFNHLKDFQTNEVDGIMINPGSVGFILNNILSEVIFNKNRERVPVSKGYDVKVRFNNFRPLTWRDLIIPDNITFMELDDILKTLWGFNGTHLSCFLIRKDKLTIIDGELANDSMMTCDYEANSTLVSEIFDKYNKITYWYDFGDDWQFDIEIKKKVDYDKDYVTIKRFKGKYNPIEDCGGVYGLSEVVYYAEHPDEKDSSYYCGLVDYLYDFDMEFSQLFLENKSYTKSVWHRSQYFEK